MVISCLVRFMTFLSLTSHSSSATCEMRPGEDQQDAQSERYSQAVLTEVVRDDNDTSFELLDGGSKGIDRALLMSADANRHDGLVELTMSKWLVGSSRRMTLGCSMAKIANTTLFHQPYLLASQSYRTYRFLNPSDS